MKRTRTTPTRTLVAGSLLAGSFVFLASTILSSSSTVGCSSAETTSAPDAAEPPCNSGPFTFCDAAVPGQASCSTDEGSSEYLSRLPRATDYPVGCVINFVGARDEQGDCRLDAVCKCVLGERPNSTSVPEAGLATDAGDGDAGEDAGDATAPDPPVESPPEPVLEPTWLCE